MSVIIQCPNCNKKLKLKAVPEGKKVRCPGCNEAFKPTAASTPQKTAAPSKAGQTPAPKPAPKPKPKPKPKRPAPVEDEFVDFDDDGMYEDDGFEDDEQPAPSRRAGGKKSAGKKSAAGKKGKKNAAASKSKVPIFVGVGLLVAVLAGVGIYFAMSGGGEADVASTDTIPATDNVDANATEQSSGGPGSGAGHGSADAGHGAPGGGTAAEAAVRSENAAVPTAPANTASSGTTKTAGGVNTQWLPETSEVVAQIDVKKLLDGPLGNMLPMFGPQLEQFRQQAGFGPKDIVSVTIGVGGLSKSLSSGQKPRPEDTPAIVVIRATGPIDMAKIQSGIPAAENATQGSITYVRIPEKPPAAIWLSNSTTAVVGAEEWVLKAAQNTSAGLVVDESLFDSTSAIRVAFTPANPDAVFRTEGPPDAAGDPAKQTVVDFLKVVQPTISAAGLGLDINKDFVLTGAIKSSSPQAATETLTALQKLVDAAKVFAANPPAGEVPGPMMMMGGDSGKVFLESFKVQTNGSTTNFSFTQPDGGQQLGMVAPMMIPMMMGAAQSAQQAAGQTSGDNNLKQVALALHNFHSAWGRLPNAAPQDPAGKALLSWRVHILEFLGPNELALYKKFNLNEPWDSLTNRPLVDEMPEIYGAADTVVEPGKTLVQVPIGTGTMFEGGEGRDFSQCTDGTSRTILFVEVDPEHAVNWTEPADFAFDAKDPANGLNVTADKFSAAFVDGSLKSIDTSLAVDILKAMFTRNGGDFIPPDAL